MKSGNHSFLEHSGPVQACNGTDLPLPLPLQYERCSSYSSEIRTMQIVNAVMLRKIKKFLLRCHRFSPQLHMAAGVMFRSIWRSFTVTGKKKSKVRMEFSLSITVQQDATIYSSLFPANCSTCFGGYLHPSSGAHVNCNYNIWHWSNYITNFRCSGGVGTEGQMP